VQDTLGDQLYYFGYANVDDNPTGFFEYDEHTPENLAKFNQFRADSKASLEKVTTPGYQQKTYVHNVEEVFDILTPDDLEKLLNPAFDYARKTLRAAEEKAKNPEESKAEEEDDAPVPA